MVNDASCVLDALQIQEQEDGHPTFQEGPGTYVSHSRRGAGIETGNGQTPKNAGLNLCLAIMVNVFFLSERSEACPVCIPDLVQGSAEAAAG